MSKSKRILATIVAAALTAGIGAVQIPAAQEQNADHYAAAREVAAEGMVLLENKESALPLAKNSHVAVFGMNQLDYVDNAKYSVSLLQGLQNKEEEGKISLYKPLIDAYQAAYNSDSAGKGRKGQIELTDELLNGAKDFADTAIITIGRFTEEGTDMEPTPGGYYLSADEEEMVEAVSGAGFDRVVVVLNVATVIDSSWFKDNDKIDAVLLAWLGGMEGGNAMADILCGDKNPSGKLPDTFAKSYDDYPSSNFTDSSAYAEYTEDSYVGYRYFETIPGAYDKVNYEFGYGLSYTTFALSDQKVSKDGDNITASVTVKNTGNVAGKEVVQLYFSAPQGELGKPAKQLAAFAKTDLLAPGESQVLTLSFAINDMASYDDTGKTGHESAYVLEAGDYEFYLGTSVRSCEKSDYVYSLDELVVAEQLTENLKSTRLEKRLLADGTYEELSMELPDPTTAISAEGVTKVQCENYTEAEANIAIENPETGPCVGYFNYARYVCYDLMVEEAGTYYITLRAANGHGFLANCINVYLDGKKQDVTFDMEQTGFEGGNTWFTFIDSKPFALTLPEGRVQLKLECNVGEGPNLDYMLFQKDEPAYTMNTISSGSRLKAAEDYYEKTDTVKAENCTDEDGGTSLGYCNPGEWLSYHVQVAESGTYQLTARIASEQDTGAFQVLVDDEVIADFPAQAATGGWQTWRTTDPINVELTAGEHVMKILFTGSTLNLNWLEFTKEGEGGDPSDPGNSGDEELIMLTDVYEDPSLMDAFIDQMTLEELADMSQGQPGGDTGGIGNLSRLGVPTAGTADGALGLHVNTISYPATAWPCAILTASTFNTELIEEMAQMIGEECAEAKIDILLGPSMNIHRNPLCGRNFEYYSEDPLVSGKMASAFVNGLQSQGIGATVKHFALNNRETNRRTCDSRVSERAAREIYLKGFQMVVDEADPWAIMSSYNPINGVKGSQNEELLTNILREEWGYEGVVMSDWDTGAPHVSEAVAGTDVKMPNGTPNSLISAVEDPDSGLTRDILERNVERILNLVMKSKTFYNKIHYTPYEITYGTRLKAAETYYEKSSGVKAETCSDEGGGMALGYCEPGEWLTYKVNVKESGSYHLFARIASERSTGAFQVLMDDEVIADFPAQPSTGGWQIWRTTDPIEVELTAGEHEMKILFTGSVLNLNWLEFAEVGELPDTSSDQESDVSSDNSSQEPPVDSTPSEDTSSEEEPTGSEPSGDTSSEDASSEDTGDVSSAQEPSESEPGTEDPSQPDSDGENSDGTDNTPPAGTGGTGNNGTTSDSDSPQTGMVPVLPAVILALAAGAAAVIAKTKREE